MRIISKFHDYYDTALGYGADPNVLYIRSEEIVDVEPPSRTYLYDRFTRLEFDVDRVVIGFCGKLYPVLVLEETKGFNTTYKHFYSAAEYLKYSNSFKKKNSPTNREVKRYHYRRYNDNSKEAKQLLDRFFSGADYKQLLDVFQEHKVPIFVRNYRKDPDIAKYRRDVHGYKLNANLKEYEFYRIFDSFRAFQEISMYIGGVLGVGEPNTVEISNDDMRDKKGFNDKSFKQVSPGKKHRRRNK